MSLLFFLPVVLFFSSLQAQSNPFLVSFPEKHDLDDTDFTEVQTRLRAIDLSETLDALYPSFFRLQQRLLLRKKEDFAGRITRGIRQTLIDKRAGRTPKKTLYTCNGGGNRCVVSFASYDGIYSDFLDTLPKALSDTGFQGSVLVLQGGFPNPTGKEIRYAGVPYAFKIFALLEAKKYGFTTVLWIDSALLPLKDPSPVFEQIEKNGCFFQPKKNGKRYLLPATRDVLLKETGIDMYETPCIRARVIGLDLQAEKVSELLDRYYTMTELGTPFLSCFPEEYVLGALLARSPAKWPMQTWDKLVINARKLSKRNIKNPKEEGYIFLLRDH